MKAIVLDQVDHFPKLNEVDIPTPKVGSISGQIIAASLNHRDIWIMKGKYAGIKTPIILGSDGICAINGERVIINPGLNWGKDERFQSHDFQILGMPENGTFAEFVCVPSENIFAVPTHLDDMQAAALPLAGVTAYRALFVKSKIKKNENILINGVGGGVASMAMLFGIAGGANVFVSSSSEEKIQKAIDLGATGGVNYTNREWQSDLMELSGGIDVIIDSAGGERFGQLLRICKPGARIAIYGGSLGSLANISPQILFWKQISIFGTTMGSPKDFHDMLDFVSLYDIVPIVDRVFNFDEVELAFQHMMDGKQFGKIVFVPN